jgi:hypothetical protein
MTWLVKTVMVLILEMVITSLVPAPMTLLVLPSMAQLVPPMDLLLLMQLVLL